MTPEFLADQIERSRANLGLETIDVFYLHNPETQLGFVPRSEFDARIRRAFQGLEQAVAAGKIRYYGTATWNGYRVKPDAADALNLTRLIEIAREAGGDGHHFRFIQLPFNLGMVEAFVQGSGLLETAQRAGIAVVASASLLQGRLASNLPDALAEKITGPRNRRPARHSVHALDARHHRRPGWHEQDRARCREPGRASRRAAVPRSV